MKYITSLFLLLITISFSFAQVDRSQMPKPGPAPQIQLGDIQSFELENGLKVFVVQNNKLPRVAFSLQLDVDPMLEGPKAGYVDMAGQLLRRGTSNRSKDQLDEEVDFIGASLNTSSTGVYAASLKKHTPKLLEIMADVVLNAKFSEEELEKIKTQAKSGLAAAKNNPAEISSRITNQVIYGADHPYGDRMTEETLENISLTDCNNYYRTHFKPNFAYLAIVGDINVEEAKTLVKKHFGEWKEGNIRDKEYSVKEAPDATTVVLVDRPAAVQSVLNITNTIDLKPGADDEIAAKVMNTVLGGGASFRLFQNLREANSFTYGAYSSIDADEQVGYFSANADVRNTATDSAVTEFLYELNRIRDKKVEAKELETAIKYMTGNFARSLENPQTIAQFAINIDRYDLPKDYYQNYLKKLAAVSLEDVQKAAKKYIQPENLYVVVVGKAEDVEEGLKKFGKIKYYDIDGNQFDPNEMKLPEGLTAQQVLNKNIEAKGGRSKMESVKSMEMSMAASVQGMSIITTVKKRKPNLSKTIVDFGMGVQKSVYDGKKGMVSNPMGGANEYPEGEDLEEMARQSAMFPELNYQEWGYKAELKKMDKVEGEDCYVVEIIRPNGKTSLQYYSVESGLLRQRVSTEEVEGMGTITQTSILGDYMEEGGIKFPGSLKQSTPNPQIGMLEFEVKSIKLNGKISKKEFKLD